jgi:LmeA-like phospholipid-binding
MQIITIILSGLLTLVSPVGTIFERVAEKAVLDQIYAAEELEVRVDNTPSYQLLQGKIDRLRFAGRGLYLTPEFRIDTIEFETDSLDVDLERLRAENQASVPQFLRQPLQGAIRLVLREADLNQALRSPAVLEQLRQGQQEFSEGTEAQSLLQRYQLLNPEIDFLGENRLSLQAEIQDQRDNDRLKVRLESELRVVQGSKINLVNPKLWLNDEEAPANISRVFAKFVNQKLDLTSFDSQGLQARVIQLNMNGEQIEIVSFLRIDNGKVAATLNQR